MISYRWKRLSSWDKHTIYAAVTGFLCGAFLTGFVLWA